MKNQNNISKGIIDRIFKSWKTSLIGLLIILGSLGLVYAEKASLTEALAFIIGGIGLFFIKEKPKP